MLLSPLPPTIALRQPKPNPVYIPPSRALSLEPMTAVGSPTPVSTALQTTCRRLQSLIASTHRSLRSPSTTSNPTSTTALQSPIDLRAHPFRSHKAAAAAAAERHRKLRNVAPAKIQRTTTKRIAKPARISIPAPLASHEFQYRGLGKENAAPTTPLGQSNAPPVLPLGLGEGDFECLWEEERRGDDLSRALQEREANDEGTGERKDKKELSQYDEAVVGSLLKQLRLRNGNGGKRGRTEKARYHGRTK
ncbi:MAG: hypothetical protein Q9219_002333 [cf. Caloplaca sp. 3 TL-2023]